MHLEMHHSCLTFTPYMVVHDTLPGSLRGYGQSAEIKKIIERWKKSIQRLKIYEKQYGHSLVKMLEDYVGQDLPAFDDSLEAAVYIVMVGMVKEHNHPL